MSVYRKHVFVCTSGKTCPLQGDTGEMVRVMREEIKKHGLKSQIRINKSGCLDQCGNGPMMVVYPEGTWYAHLTVEDCLEIVESHLRNDQPVERCFYDGRGRIVR